METLTGLQVLLAALTEREQAKTASDPEDNPFANHTLKDLSHGLMKGADNTPAINMATKVKVTGENRDVEEIEDSPAFQMEAARFETAREGRADKSARRMAQAKARAERKVEFDRIASARFTPNPERMDRAWLVVVHLVPIITKIARSKQRWANRLLGSNADDIPQMALEKTALVLAKQDRFDLDVLAIAAEQLGVSDRAIPGDQPAPTAEDTDLVKEVKKARKWLMGMVNNRVMGSLVDAYTSQNNLRWDNLDIIATVMASINGVGDDPMLNRFKADRAPAFLGSRFQSPGGVDADLLAMSISAGITAHGLDPLVEFLLDDEHRRVDGTVKWSEHARDIFLLTPGGYGEWMWQQVEAATADHQHGRRRRGVAARDHVRSLFAWLPGLIMATVDSFDFQFRMWHCGQAIMWSDFEEYLGERPDRRLPLQPALKYASVREAAQALGEHLACLTTGNDLVASAVNA